MLWSLEIQSDEYKHECPPGPRLAFRGMAIVFLKSFLRIRDRKTRPQLKEMSHAEKETVEKIMDRDGISISHENVSDSSLGRIIGIVKRLSINFSTLSEVFGEIGEGKGFPVDLRVNNRGRGLIWRS
jgi:hypothetical protein